MRIFAVFWIGLSFFSCGVSPTAKILSDSENRFPLHPDLKKTPGSKCQKADDHRYAENINYCNRNVKSETKNKIIDEYDREFHYSIREMLAKVPRTDFKIDHHIPLCMGGSNEEDNLWPQHRTVFEKTDKIEELLCVRMRDGKMRQLRAIELVQDTKQNLEKAPELLRKLKSGEDL